MKRVAMLSAHTSPREQPGGGDAGGMNVYVLETAAHLVRRGVAVDVLTLTTDEPLTVELESGVRVHAVAADDLGLTDVVRSADLVHSHYWKSGLMGITARRSLGIPLVHSMHTMARVKNLNLAIGDRAEPDARVTAEIEIVRTADRLVANTAQERDELVSLYGADAGRVDVIHPGVNDALFRPQPRAAARAELGLGDTERIVLFAGRLQPHKGPDIAVEALAGLPADVRLVVVGGPSGSGLDNPSALTDLAARLGVADRLTMVPPVAQSRLANWYAAADVVCVPSHSESFGLVALEAQACGTPVVAASVGGLATAVIDGVTGVLVAGHDPNDYARALATVLDDADLRTSMGLKAAVHAAGFRWDVTVDRLLATYANALSGV